MEMQFVNKKYLIGYSHETKSLGYYAYHFNGVDENGVAGKTVQDAVTCQVNCTEVVTIEYGPPVATTAGLCFEYDVKVTSRVNCDIITPPKPPNKITTYCTPSPQCVLMVSFLYFTSKA